MTKPVTLQLDASQKALGAVLYQDKGPVAYASKAMDDTQRNYAQIEKELLARLSLDAKDSTSISMVNMLSSRQTSNRLRQYFSSPYLKSLSQAPSRLQRMMLQLQGYDIELVYKKGTEMYIADALSRAFPKNR